MHALDLNCDMGESYGIWQMGADAAILPYVSSANIACGAHAGDPGTMAKTVQAAVRFGVAVGAHPGYPDKEGFGRRYMAMSPMQVHDSVLYQIGAMQAFATANGTTLHHVKIHGALYNQAAKNAELADAICSAIRSVDPALLVYGLAGSQWVAAAERAGLPLIQEVFGDRTYQDDGSLTPRTQPNAMITDLEAAVTQVLGMVRDGVVRSVTGKAVPVQAQTLCIHGDQPGAAAFAQGIRAALEREGVAVRAPQRTA